MSVARVFRISTIAVLAALALSGCMRRNGPVATTSAQPGLLQGGLDQWTYGRRGLFQRPPRGPVPYAVAPVAVAPMAPAVVQVAAPPPVAFAPAPIMDTSYRLDAGDRLRIVVYGQEGLTNSYAVDAAGFVTMPLIGAVPARGCTPAELAEAIAARLRGGYIREPYVAAEVEAYRPFFILGEVAAPGQYPYVPNMTVESAVAIAGGYTPRAKRNIVQMTRSNQAGSMRAKVPPGTPMLPGDTIVVGERWF